MMKKFNVGDWVVGKYNKNPIHIKTIGTTPTNSSITINGTFSVDQFTPWQPKEGEFVIPKTKTKESFNVFKYSKEYKGFELEPFIGELPSFLKD